MPKGTRAKGKGKGKGPCKGCGRGQREKMPSISESDTEDVVMHEEVVEVQEETAAAAEGAEVTEVTEADPDPDAAPQPAKPKKRAKKTCHMKDEEEECMVIEWVEANPILWNSKHKEFKLKQKKERMWQEKAQEMGMMVSLKIVINNFLF